MEQVDYIVVGAGVVGLAVARELGQRFQDKATLLLERHEKFGQDTSSRNSEVMHAGMYYPTGSLKAEMCVKGLKMLYKFCDEHKVPYQRIGKLVIARDESEIASLEGILKQGKANGVTDLRLLDQNEIKEMEPNVLAVAALYSPSTGIIDSHKLMLQLERQAFNNSVMLAYKHELISAKKVKSGYEVEFIGPDGEKDQLQCTWLINCAGLFSDRIPAWLGINVDESNYKIHPTKGEYFSVSTTKSALISHLVYPPPLKGLKGLGTHVTKSLDGRARLGPNVCQASHREDYDVDESHLEEFYQAAKSYLPFIEKDDLQPDMAGMRPKLEIPSGAVADFVICHENERNLPGFINLVGIESPGLTSCLAIADKVLQFIDQGMEG